jgi:hypothetical protein
MEQTMVRTSERSIFKRCPQRWWWSSVEGLAPKEPSKALWFGTGWHFVMADYYKPGKKRSKDYIDLWRDFCDTPDAHGQYDRADAMGEEWVDLRKLGESMLEEYVKEYQGDKTWDVIQTEMTGSVMIPTWDGEDKFQYNFTFDGVYRDTKSKKIKLMEHKTAKAISISHLTLDDQGLSYWAVAGTILRKKGVLGPKENIREIMYNFVKKGMPDTRPVGPDGQRRNKPGKMHYIEQLTDASVAIPPKGLTIEKLEELAAREGVVVYGDISKNQPQPMFKRHPVLHSPKERKTTVEQMQAEHANMEAMRQGKIPVYKTPDSSCSWQCPFFTMCELHQARGDIEEFKKAVYIKRDAHEVYKLDRKVA